MKYARSKASYKSYEGLENRQRVNLGKIPHPLLKQFISFATDRAQTTEDKKFEKALWKIVDALHDDRTWLTARQYDVLWMALPRTLKPALERLKADNLTVKTVFSALGSKD